MSGEAKTEESNGGGGLGEDAEVLEGSVIRIHEGAKMEMVQKIEWKHIK